MAISTSFASAAWPRADHADQPPQHRHIERPHHHDTDHASGVAPAHRPDAEVAPLHASRYPWAPDACLRALLDGSLGTGSTMVMRVGLAELFRSGAAER